MASTSEPQLDLSIEMLVEDVELPRHAMYRSDLRQNTVHG